MKKHRSMRLLLILMLSFIFCSNVSAAGEVKLNLFFYKQEIAKELLLAKPILVLALI